MSFKAINLSEKMITSLTRQGYFEPSSVQLKVIPKAIKGNTLMVQSATGTGKTLCYLLPIIENIDCSKKTLQAIVIAPTRELASQIYNFAIPFTKEFTNLKVRLLKAGEEIDESLKGLSENPQIIIGTPGRLVDVLVKNNALKLNNVKTVVLDEADMLLKEGYFSDIDQIVDKLAKVQFLVFSATLEKTLASELDKYVGSNISIINEEILTSQNVKHYLIDIKHIPQTEAVEQFINIINPYLLLIFASKKEKANEIYSYLRSKKYNVGLLTGNLSSRERKNVMKALKNEQIYILVCSDMVARGLDIEDVSDILNVDLPMDLDFYFHRAGRTGRFSKKGNCYTFYNSDSVKRPLELISRGVRFEYLILKGNTLNPGKAITKKELKPKRADSELNKEIKKIVNISKAKNKKVKPGYKKKTRLAVDKAKRKHRRELIKKDIRRQRVERYKKENNGR